MFPRCRAQTRKKLLSLIALVTSGTLFIHLLLYKPPENFVPPPEQQLIIDSVPRVSSIPPLSTKVSPANSYIQSRLITVPHTRDPALKGRLSSKYVKSRFVAAPHLGKLVQGNSSIPIISPPSKNVTQLVTAPHPGKSVQANNSVPEVSPPSNNITELVSAPHPGKLVQANNSLPQVSPPSKNITQLVTPPYSISPEPVYNLTYEARLYEHSGEWMGFRDPIQLFVYSAFYDDRTTLGSWPVVRVIGVSEILEVEGVEFRCVVNYGVNTKSVIVPSSYLKTGVGYSPYGIEIRQYIFNCLLKDAVIPDKVSIIMSPTSSPSFFVPVEIPGRPEKKEDFAVCVSITFWRPNPIRIVEWLEMLQILGADKVVIYNNSLHDSSARVFQFYQEQGFVDFRQSHNFLPGEDETIMLLHMSAVINDCMYRNMHRYKRIIVTDLDELIIPRIPKHKNYKDMLEYIDEIYDLTESPGSYIFRNVYFFLDLPHDETMPNLMTLRERWHIEPSERFYSVKSIIDPQACTNMQNHMCWGQSVLTMHRLPIEVDPMIAMNQHYKICHLDNWDRRPGRCKELMEERVHDDVMLKYKDQLISQVSKRAKQLNIKHLFITNDTAGSTTMKMPTL